VATKVEYYQRIRDDAVARGDFGVARAVSADLRRWGVPESSSSTTEPRPKGGRPKLPRCEHGRIADRCLDCQQED
jgi:hypothetical protein